MNRIQSLLATTVFITISSIVACGNNSQTKGDDNSLLWEISGNGLKKPSYLFGTIHVICDDDYLWTDKMDRSFSKADKLCLEMDMTDPDLQKKVAFGLMDTSGRKFSSYFTSGDYVKASSYFIDSLQMNIADFEQFRPFAVMAIFQSKLTGCNAPVSYEEKLTTQATIRKMQILGVEVAEEQIELIGLLSPDTIISQIMKIVEGAPRDSIYKELIRVYRNQNVSLLYSMIRESKELTPIEAEKFVDDRNVKWIPRMKEMMKGGSIFFAFGAGHLGGEKGIISLLRKKGYTVKAIR